MDDLISREDALRELNGACSNWEDDAKVQEIVMAIPSAKPTGDLISRADAIEAVTDIQDGSGQRYYLAVSLVDKIRSLPSADATCATCADRAMCIMSAPDGKWKACKDYRPSAEAVQGWIPCYERLPEDIKPVIVTWKNTDPASYYQYIVGKHYIGTAHYYRGKWYWYSSVTEDLLAEYGKCDTEEFDEAIEAVAWMPLPKPYKGGDDTTGESL